MKGLFCTVKEWIKSRENARYCDGEWGYDVRVGGCSPPPYLMLWYEDNRGFLDSQHIGLVLVGWGIHAGLYWYVGTEPTGKNGLRIDLWGLKRSFGKKEQYDDTIPF